MKKIFNKTWIIASSILASIASVCTLGLCLNNKNSTSCVVSTPVAKEKCELNFYHKDNFSPIDQVESELTQNKDGSVNATFQVYTNKELWEVSNDANYTLTLDFLNDTSKSTYSINWDKTRFLIGNAFMASPVNRVETTDHDQFDWRCQHVVARDGNIPYISFMVAFVFNID
jgi:hypothetical protein